MAGLFPMIFLFGDAAAVISYNCFDRPLDVIINRACGIPVLNYFDDFGALVPAPIRHYGAMDGGEYHPHVGGPDETIKSLGDTQLTSLGLIGSPRALREE